MSASVPPTDAQQPGTDPKPPAATGANAAPIKFMLGPRALRNLAPTQTTVTFPRDNPSQIQPQSQPEQKINVAIEKGDVYVLGLKKASGAEKTTTGGEKGGKKGENSDAPRGNDTFAADLAPLGEAYEIDLLKIETDTSNLVRVLGVVYRRKEEAMPEIIFQLIPYSISLCKLFYHSKSVDEQQHHNIFRVLVPGHHDATKDANGLKLDDAGWGRIEDGVALFIDPGSADVTTGGGDIALEITFKSGSSHRHDITHAFGLVHRIFAGDHTAIASSVSHSSEKKDSVDERDSEDVTIGGHILSTF